MAKKKKKFVEPDGGWFFHPSGDMCMSCTKLYDNCSLLPFRDMKSIMETYEGNKVVKCTKHDYIKRIIGDPMKAILLPYCVDQNEPSQPLKRLFLVPDKKEDRDEALKVLFHDTFGTTEEEFPTVVEEKTDQYGDVVVAAESGDLFIFVTYVYN